MRWPFHFSFCLNGNKPLFADIGDGDIAYFSLDVSAFAVPEPAKFWEEDAAIVLIEFDFFGIGITKTDFLAFFLKARKVCPFGKEVLKGSI